MTSIPFNSQYVAGRESYYVNDAIGSAMLAGDGKYTKKSQQLLQAQLNARAVLTHSATGALEMAALLSGVSPGDEVIMPSFTFVSTANAFALRGATPVFVDIREDTLNLDETLLEQALSEKTRVIVPVHYAGVACAMDRINALAQQHGLLVIEDAAQGIFASYKGAALGALGDMGALSFHATKNINCGEGGAFVTRSEETMRRAEIIREKGTNRSLFLRGEIDKYSWVAMGSSYLPSELNAAYLLGQLEAGANITAQRLAIWQRYYQAFQELERRGLIRLPTVPSDCGHNGHIFYFTVRDASTRNAVLEQLRLRGIAATFHYVPLHSASFAQGRCRTSATLAVTERMAASLVRLPVWPGIEAHLDEVCDAVTQVIGACC